MNAFTHWSCAVTSATTSEPVATSDLKDYLRISSSETAEDTLLGTLVTVARKQVEAATGRALMRQLYTLHLDAFPDESTTPIVLPITPLISSSAFTVTSYDDENTASVWSTSEYRLDTVSEPGRLVVDDAYDWPSDTRNHDAVVIAFPAGYSTAASGVPEPLTLAVKAWAAHLYEHRGDEHPTHSPDWDYPRDGMPPMVQVLLQDYLLPSAG